MADEDLPADDEKALADLDADSEDSPGKGKKKLILFAVLGLLLVGGGGAGVYFSGILDEPEEIVDSQEEPPPPFKYFYNLPPTVTNLYSSDGRGAVLKARVVLEINDAADAAELDLLQPRIIDILQVYLRELRVDDLKGSQGLENLRHELLKRINEAVEPVEVSGILFSEILIQ